MADYIDNELGFRREPTLDIAPVEDKRNDHGEDTAGINKEWQIHRQV
jgi:hypothetical protein